MTIPENLRQPLGAFTVLGHRGAKGHAPENTLASFAKAIDLRATMAELDIHLSKDNELIVMHDPAVDRTTGGTGPIADLTLQEIKKLDAGAWFGHGFAEQRVPTLQEVIDLTRGRIALNVEVKGSGKALYPGIVELLIEHIRLNRVGGSVVVSTFHREYLRELRSQAPDISAALLYSRPIAEPWKEAKDEGWDLHPHLSLVDGELIDEAHSRGIVVRAWNPNEAQAMRSLIALGVDGIGTDFPDALLTVWREASGLTV